MSVEVINETGVDIEIAEFRDIAEYVLAQLHVSTDAELSIMFIDPEPMKNFTLSGWICRGQRTS